MLINCSQVFAFDGEDVRFMVLSSAATTITIYDSDGNILVNAENMTNITGTNLYYYDYSNISSGLYPIEFYNGSERVGYGLIVYDKWSVYSQAEQIINDVEGVSKNPLFDTDVATSSHIASLKREIDRLRLSRR